MKTSKLLLLITALISLNAIAQDGPFIRKKKDLTKR